ncbi:MAG: prolipoprotein diacylglyceryl transferase [Acidobacteria bacterium]|nr:prolipoprotein diacylglyceryl transferase [Acidobacteriota bacterium]
MHPRLFGIGPYDIPGFWGFGPFHVDFTLHTYGALLALAFVSAILVVVRGARREGVPEERIFDMSVYTVISALVGAKLLLLLADLRYYLDNPQHIMSTLRSGGVFYGGFLSATLVSYLYLRRYKLPAWKVADLVAPGIAIGQSIGRLGCLSAGCCYGKPAAVPWAVTFTDLYSFETVGTPLDLPLHPTQIYESLATFVLFVLLMLAGRRKTFDGQIFWLYVSLYSIIRFGLEFFRNDERGTVLDLISTSQFIAILMFPLSIFMYVVLRKRAMTARQAG